MDPCSFVLNYKQERATTFLSNVYREDGARYGYIGNLCVAKCLRRQGIARNMIYLAVEAAKSEGICPEISSFNCCSSYEAFVSDGRG